MPKSGCSKTPQQEDFSLSNDMVEKQTGKKDKDKVSLTKTPKLDRSDGGKEVRERATKRKLPFTVGANGEQKDSDTEKKTRSNLNVFLHVCIWGGVWGVAGSLSIWFFPIGSLKYSL
ncbi:unknown_gene_16442 [Phodopus roborovskii]|uniref:Unknown_gene_16442 protein n=1 Tax=Phodopus roborovskii TaxID=109678 RepID=A0AAV0A2S8_PHORO|nr:unknown_gene_16442 [Phodopus roborovskii]